MIAPSGSSGCGLAATDRFTETIEDGRRALSARKAPHNLPHPERPLSSTKSA